MKNRKVGKIMFIQNKIGEVVNVDHILAIKFYDDSAPYEIHVFTEKAEIVFDYESCDALKSALNRLEKHLIKCCLRWAKFKNWWFRSDRIMSINQYVQDIMVYMIGRDFKVYMSREDNKKEMVEAKKQIEDSLSEFIFNTLPVFERLD